MFYLSYQYYLLNLYPMNRTRCLSGRKLDKSFSASDSTCYNYYTATLKKAKNQRVGAEVSDWTQLLKQISTVTNKVYQLCKEDKKKNHHSRPRIQMKINLSKLDRHQAINHIPQNQENNILTEKRSSSLKNCNPDCHFLMYQCMKLNNQNKKLIQEKQHLQKRLYFESKEKRQLRWALEKQQEHGKQFDDYRKQVIKNNSFTLQHSRVNGDEMSVNFGLSESSYMTAKKSSSVLKERSSNIIKPKENTKNVEEDDSLLIDLSVRGSENVKKTQTGSDKLGKILKSVSFQKNLDDLLEVCKNENDPDRKKQLRKQMKHIAQQIKSLKSE